MTEYSYRRRSRERALKKRKRIIMGAGIGAGILVILLAVILIKHFVNVNEGNTSDGNDVNSATEKEYGVIEDEVYIEGIAVGGMNYDEASAAVTDYAGSLLSKQVTITVNDNMLTTNLAAVGVVCNTEEALTGAFAAKEQEKVNLTFDIVEGVFGDFVETECTQYEVKPKNAKLKRVNGEFVVKRGRVGKLIDVEATRAELLNAVNTSIINGSVINVNAIIIEENPQYTSKDMARCKDVLGKFSTTFQEGQTDRSANLRNAAGFIDGTVLFPGETFSVADTIYPLSEDNGYKAAPSYADGQVVDSLGGGVCQVSTTLYNAVLLAELEIVQRQPHSMVVSYVAPSMDAAIAGDYKNLKFSNNTDAPIYIQASVYGGVITFTVYGEETRPASRTIKYESEIVETIEPGADVVTKDPNQPEGYEKVTQTAHVGYVANLYKVVYENGVQVSRDKVNYSKYNAEPRYVTIGTKKVKDKDKDKDKDKNNKDNNGSDKNNNNDKTTTNNNNNNNNNNTNNNSSSNNSENADSSSNAETPAATDAPVEEPKITPEPAAEPEITPEPEQVTEEQV